MNLGCRECEHHKHICLDTPFGYFDRYLCKRNPKPAFDAIKGQYTIMQKCEEKNNGGKCCEFEPKKPAAPWWLRLAFWRKPTDRPNKGG